MESYLIFREESPFWDKDFKMASISILSLHYLYLFVTTYFLGAIKLRSISLIMSYFYSLMRIL